MNSLPPVLASKVRRTLALALTSGIAILASTLLSGDVFLHAQAGRAGLIAQAVNESDRITLSGNTHPLATRAADRGIVPASMPAERMILLLRRSPEQELALRAQIQALHDSNSPSFHHWLTPEQFGAQWGAADSDIATVTAWLQSHGFQVKGPSAGRTAIEFSGNAGQILAAFHTEIHTYEVNGEVHHANATDPQIPAALAPVVAGITSLNDFRPKSMATKGKRGIYNTTTHTARPDLTVSGSYGHYLYVGPADAATIYNSPIKALNPAATGATYDGTGASIGIIGDSNISIAQNANYRKLFGLSVKPPTVIIDGGVNPGENGDAVEAYLDTEVANGIAPGAKVYFYTAADTTLNYGLDLATLRAVNDNLADILNLSFGACEGGLGLSENYFYEGIWEQAAAQGQSVTVSTGDSGSAGCDDPNSQAKADYGLQVNGLASTPFDVAVGGTDFAVLAGPTGYGQDFTKYVSTSNNAATLRSALGYIPEVPWNDTFENFPPGTIASTIPLESPYANIVGSGGGKSNCVSSQLNGNNLICNGGYPKPSWQVAPGVPADGARDLPDVSLFAANGFFYASWGICTDQDEDGNGNPIADCTPGSNGLPPDEFYIYGVGGTSSSAPAFAGVLALVRQKTGDRIGQADYVLYDLARKSPAVFHDVTTGNNSVPCAAGTPNCRENSKGADYLTGYDAAAGYDLASGLGSVDVSALVANWASAGLSSTSTSLTVAPVSFEHGKKATADITVTTSGGTPTGVVALSAEANPPSLPLAKSIGTYNLKSNGSTGDFTLNYLPGGNYKVIASYGGSDTLSQSVSTPVSLDITAEPSVLLVGAVAYNPTTGASVYGSTLPYGFYLGFTAQPYGINSPYVNGVLQPDGVATGKVTFTAGSIFLGTAVLATNGVAEAVGHSLNPGTYTVTASYTGDNSFKPSTQIHTVTISKAATDLKLTASANHYEGTPITFTIALTTNSIGVAPSGEVALEIDNKVIASGKIEGTAATTTTEASGKATVTTSNLPPGNFEIKAVYLGDAIYAESSSNYVQMEGRPTFSIGDIRLSLPAEHSTAAGFIPVTSEARYTGTIDFTCVLISQAKTSTPAECAMDPATRSMGPNATAYQQILIFGKGTKLPTGVTTGTSDRNNGVGLGIGLGAGSAALAFGLFFGIPARRRGWRSILSAVLLLVALGSFSACVTPAKLISAGQYTFKVTGTDSRDATNTASGTVHVIVY